MDKLGLDDRVFFSLSPSLSPFLPRLHRPVFSTARLTFRCRAVSLSTKARINYFVSPRPVSHVPLIVEFSQGFKLRRSRMRDARIYFLIQVSVVVMISLLQCTGDGVWVRRGWDGHVLKVSLVGGCGVSAEF